MEKRRYKTNLCIEIDTPIEKIEKFKTRVEQMLQKREGIYDESIIVKFDEIVDNGINILVCSYTDSVDYPSYLAEKENINYKIINHTIDDLGKVLEEKQKINFMLMKLLAEEKIELAYDTKTVYVKK